MANELTRKGGRGKLSRPGAESPFRSLQNEMNRLFNDFWLEPFGATADWTGTFIPSVDVNETDKEVIVSAELPGLDDKDIDVNVTDNILRIQGEKKEEEEETEKKGYYRKESSYGRFLREIELPAEVDQDKAKAEFKKGVLKINLPKKPEAKEKSKKIKITSS